jgi:indolepyruvate ferredoxin oxidoreductase beta subunit
MESTTVLERTLNVLLAGIGGQGVLTAGQLLSEAALEAGYDVKKSEIHGMAQRGGVVTSHVRVGQRVFSPVISPGEVDLLVGFEEAEALRWRPEVRPGGTLVVNCLRVLPPVVNLGLFSYPEDPVALLRSFAGTVYPVEASAMAVEMGSPRLAGTILMGVAGPDPNPGPRVFPRNGPPDQTRQTYSSQTTADSARE